MKTFFTSLLFILCTCFLQACSKQSQFTGFKGDIDTTELAKCNLPTDEPVIMFTASWCSACKQTKALLAKNNISYLELDVEANDNNRKAFDCMGGSFVPYLFVEGKFADTTDHKEMDLALLPYAN